MTTNGVAATPRKFPESVKRDAAARRELTKAVNTASGTGTKLSKAANAVATTRRKLSEAVEGDAAAAEGVKTKRRKFTKAIKGDKTAVDKLNCRGQVSELQLSLSTAQQTISQLRSLETRDWVTPRDEIQITDKCLGRGGWGSVNEGTYCGCTVAVKEIHELILSPHNIRRFEREMNIASKCRHPHLLQFIGATIDEGSPLFVTELMEKSLRALLEQRQLSETEIRVISLDVARALNYLHQKKPEPIIHRDVSSANVLLWRQGDQWRAKVSDYGTANFMQQILTVAPGAMNYSAREARTSNQTVKVSISEYSRLFTY